MSALRGVVLDGVRFHGVVNGSEAAHVDVTFGAQFFCKFWSQNGMELLWEVAQRVLDGLLLLLEREMVKSLGRVRNAGIVWWEFWKRIEWNAIAQRE